MEAITIVTGNPGKVRELEAMAKGKLHFVMHELDIDEIQSLDPHEIVEDKAKKAYEQIKRPVIVDDVAADLDSLQGLPGPFIKFFNQVLGEDALVQLSKVENEQVNVTCIAAFYDGQNMVLSEGTIRGTVVKPRGTNGFGFDTVIVPDGQTRTMGEMSDEEKMQISHRGKAFMGLIEKLGGKA
jgi:non-canonical purine NTP pyrophosphatase (RdgB/HAM1 family)